MDWTTRIWQQLFGRPSGVADRLFHGPLERSDAHRERSAAWLAGDRPARVLERLSAEAAEGGGAVRFSTPQAEGFEFSLGDALERHEPDLLLDLIGERVRALGYRRQLADTRIGADGVRRDRTYWKPKWASEGPPIDQRFGNILLELRRSEAGNGHLKVLVTRYTDRLYTPALSATTLWSELFASTRA